MTKNKFVIIKAVANIVSGISMVTLIAFGVSYLQFKNAFVFEDIMIEITNNPVTQGQEIEFMMLGSKSHSCNSKTVYGKAYSDDSEDVILLNKFTQQYVHNTRPGELIPNQWKLAMPANMYAGDWRVSMTGEFDCNYLIFTMPKSQTYSNILLVVK